MKHSIIVVTLFLIATLLQGQVDPKSKGLEFITPSLVSSQLQFLSSDFMEGRETGEKGAFLAADYIAGMFRVYGLEPAGDRRTIMSQGFGHRNEIPKIEKTYFQQFLLVRYKPGKEQSLSLESCDKNGITRTILDYGTDYRVEPGSTGEEFTAPVVFVGYGITDEESGWDDLKGLDVSGKVLVRIWGYPGMGDTLSKGYKAFGKRVKDWETSPLSKRDEMAEGALAVIELPEYSNPQWEWAVNDPDKEGPDYLDREKELQSHDWRMTLAADTLKKEPLHVSLSKRSWWLLSENLSIDLEKYRKNAAELKHCNPILLEGKEIHLKTTVESDVIIARNVIAMIPGEDTSHCVVIGAHYDHMGMREPYIFNGADDNASGTVAVMTLARAFMETGVKPPKTILFAAWSAEEEGLLGSRFYTLKPAMPLARTDLYANFDMISRNSEKDTLGIQCSFMYSKTMETLKEITELNDSVFQIGLRIRFRPGTGQSGGSDNVPFARKGIPFTYTMAAFHPDYHTPADEVEKCDIGKMVRIIKLNYLDLWDVLKLPARTF